jgi:uncharacterized protein
MKTQPLPKYIQPKRFCEDKVSLAGTLPISSFERLKEVLADDQGQVEIVLDFGQNARFQPLITGTIQVDWHLVCQRCSGKLAHSMEITCALSPINDEKYIERLDENTEPLMVEGDKIALIDLIEEELLLSMPVVPMHDTQECKQVVQKFNEDN